jgi:two-component sensor histidine kinase
LAIYARRGEFRHIVYFLVARLGLALLSPTSDVAVFWPASGIAAGTLILSGRRAHLAVVIAEERQRVLIAELDHRVKNSLATVAPSFGD